MRRERVVRSFVCITVDFFLGVEVYLFRTEFFASFYCENVGRFNQIYYLFFVYTHTHGIYC